MERQYVNCSTRTILDTMADYLTSIMWDADPGTKAKIEVLDELLAELYERQRSHSL